MCHTRVHLMEPPCLDCAPSPPPPCRMWNSFGTLFSSMSIMKLLWRLVLFDVDHGISCSALLFSIGIDHGTLMAPCSTWRIDPAAAPYLLDVVVLLPRRVLSTGVGYCDALPCSMLYFYRTTAIISSRRHKETMVQDSGVR